MNPHRRFLSEWQNLRLPSTKSSEFCVRNFTFCRILCRPNLLILTEGMAQTAFAGLLAVSIFAVSPVYNALTLAFFVLLVMGLSQADGPFARLLQTRPASILAVSRIRCTS